jgi:hypothetical protein
MLPYFYYDVLKIDLNTFRYVLADEGHFESIMRTALLSGAFIKSIVG